VRLENHGVPVQKGLGGSAALCVSLASAMLEYGNPGSKENGLFLREVNKWAFKGSIVSWFTFWDRQYCVLLW